MTYAEASEYFKGIHKESEAFKEKLKTFRQFLRTYEMGDPQDTDAEQIVRYFKELFGEK